MKSCASYKYICADPIDAINSLWNIHSLQWFSWQSNVIRSNVEAENLIKVFKFF